MNVCGSKSVPTSVIPNQKLKIEVLSSHLDFVVIARFTSMQLISDARLYQIGFIENNVCLYD